jgi:hypothetical protein
MLGDAREHSRSELFPIMKCEGKVRIPLASENSVRAALSHHLPPQTEKRSKDDIGS